MSRRHIPERSPVTDHFKGYLIAHETHHALSLTPQPNMNTLRTDEMIVRYGVQLLGKPHQALIPGLLALDYGEMLTGEAAWEFLLKRSNLHPRADVVGYRDDGTDEMLPVKWLDIVAPIQVFVYPDAASVIPQARVLALLTPDDADISAVPARLLEYLPRFSSAAAWVEGIQHNE